MEAQVDEWIRNRLGRTSDESSVDFVLRRHSEWRQMAELSAWGDFMGQVRTSRDGLVRDLISGVPNRYGERGDDEKRAMIHAFNIILGFYDSVERDANEAMEAVRRYHERH